MATTNVTPAARFSSTTNPAPCVQLTLYWNDASSTTPTTAPYVKLRNVVLYGRMAGASVDRSVTIADVLADVVDDLGVTTTRIRSVLVVPAGCSAGFIG